VIERTNEAGERWNPRASPLTDMMDADRSITWLVDCRHCVCCALFAGESIPIRLFLSPYDLTPTFKSVHNKFSVKYYLNLVLVDEEDRRYFKQQVCRQRQ
jgi:hypothetical protein